jgi:hypothetical protein
MMPNDGRSSTTNPWSAQIFVFREDALGDQLQSGQTTPHSALFKQGYSLLLGKGTRMYWRTVLLESTAK